MNKTVLSCMMVAAFLFRGLLFAQPPARQGAPAMDIGRFYGKVINGSNNRPVEAASVQLLQTKRNPQTGETSEDIVAVMLTDRKGEFSIEKLPLMGKFQIMITAIGFGAYHDEVAFDIKPGGDRSQMMNQTEKDLGNIKMEPAPQQLEGVVVTAEKSMVQMNIDRKVFNVDKSLTSIGGTAIDVMKNVPSVNVDIDGNVTLRNTSPTIFVDGRPTTMTLDQIPSEEIESIEIITNPSAKFDASGGGAGILNIVLKKNRRAGYNGNVRVNGDSRGGTGAGGNINIKQGKVNFFANGMFNNRKSRSEQSTFRKDVVEDLTAVLTQTGKPENTGNFAFGRAGIDYFPDNRNTFSLSGVLVGGTFNNDNDMDITRDTSYTGYANYLRGISSTNGSSNFQNRGLTFGYKHLFAKPGKEITADANYNYSDNKNNFVVGTRFLNSDNSIKGNEAFQKSNSKGNSTFFTAQTDFVNPINQNMKLEMGLRASVRDFNTENLNYVFNHATDRYEEILAFNSNYQFKDEVYAGYVTFSQKINNFTYQAGARVESSNYTGELVTTKQNFKNKYPFSFFPSLFLTQKLTERSDMQLNYSRKINRPNFWQLIPFYDYSDSLNIRRGNPDLRPEFTNLVELSYQLNMKKGNNLIATAYFKNTTDLIANYQYREKNPNPTKADSIFISTYENANKSLAYGVELTSMNRIAKWWSITTNLNVYNSKIDGDNLQSNVNSEQVSWFGKLNNSFTLPKNFSIQLTGDYTSKTILAPGRGGGGGRMYGGGNLSTANGFTEPVYGFDIAVKKDFLKDRSASVSISMNDFLRTKVYRVHSRADYSTTIYSIQENERWRDPQVLRVNLSWRFGKFDASLFKRKNMRGEQESMQEGMQGMGQ